MHPTFCSERKFRTFHKDDDHSVILHRKADFPPQNKIIFHPSKGTEAHKASNSSLKKHLKVGLDQTGPTDLDRTLRLRSTTSRSRPRLVWINSGRSRLVVDLDLANFGLDWTQSRASKVGLD